MADMWTFETPWGRFGIVQKGDQFQVLFTASNLVDDLGAYVTPRQALDDLVNGHIRWPSNGLDPSKAGLPDHLSEWTYQQLDA